MKISSKTMLAALLAGTTVFAAKSGTVKFINSVGAEQLNYAAKDSIWVEVADADLNTISASRETVMVKLTTSSRLGEVNLKLTETGNNTGVFHGYTLPSLSTPALKGDLSVQKGDNLFVHYADQSNDYGEIVSIRNSAAFGFTELKDTLKGSTTLTKVNSPYLMTKSVYVRSVDTLTIEPGVEVRINMVDTNKDGKGELALINEGSLRVEGNESDSIRFVSSSIDRKAGDWYGIIDKSTVSAGTKIFSFCYLSMKHAVDGIVAQNGAAGSFSLKNSNVDSVINFAVRFYSSSYSEISIEGNTLSSPGDVISLDNFQSQVYPTIRSNNITTNYGTGIFLWHSLSSAVSPNIEGNTITNTNTTRKSGYGILLSNPNISDTMRVLGNSIAGFEQGICSKMISPVIAERNNFTNCNYGFYGSNAELHKNNFNSIQNIAVYNAGRADINAKNNYWDVTATADMNAGGNPKNITSIYDNQDDLASGTVNYSGWLNAPYKENVGIIKSESTLRSSLNDIVFYPNPVLVNDKGTGFKIPYGLDGSWDVMIYDVVGNLIDRQSFEAVAGEEYLWDLNNENGVLAAGGYYAVKLKFKGRSGETKEFLRTIGVKR